LRNNTSPWELHIALDPGDPPDAPVIQIKKMIEIHTGLVEHDDFARSDVRTDLAGALVVVLPGGIENGKRRQEAMQIEPQVHLGGRLASAVFGPVHAVGNQLDDCRIHRMDSDLEAPQQSLALAS
jgi:hypothetical protein